MSTPKDIAEYLQTKAVGTVGTSIFYGSEPPKPDESITVFEYAGFEPNLQAGLEFPNIQIRVRSSSWETARARLQTIQDLLQEIGNEDGDDETLAPGITLNGTFYAAIRAAQGITSLGEDENRRMRLTQNFNITKGRN
jgi:hypothetical protein